jgi:thiol-disulfide isomerase/thioredoxin
MTRERDDGWSRRHWLLGAAAVAQGGATLPATAATPIRWPALRLVDGSTRAAEHWQGTPLVVVFWATWCSFCKRHNARLDRLFATVDERDLRILGLAIDGHEASVARHVRAHGWRFPVALDDGTLRPQFTDRRIVPMTCLVDRAGLVRERIPGEMGEADVLALPRSASLRA